MDGLGIFHAKQASSLLSHAGINGAMLPFKIFKPSSIFNDCSKAMLLLWIIFVVYVSCLSFYAVLSVPCSLAL